MSESRRYGLQPIPTRILSTGLVGLSDWRPQTSKASKDRQGTLDVLGTVRLTLGRRTVRLVKRWIKVVMRGGESGILAKVKRDD